jgi:hypothetical protein
MSRRDSHLARPICAGRLRRLTQLRREIDKWAAEGRSGRLPQPADFGLDLPDLKSGDVFCPPF